MVVYTCPSQSPNPSCSCLPVSTLNVPYMCISVPTLQIGPSGPSGFLPRILTWSWNWLRRQKECQGVLRTPWRLCPWVCGSSAPGACGIPLAALKPWWAGSWPGLLPDSCDAGKRWRLPVTMWLKRLPWNLPLAGSIKASALGPSGQARWGVGQDLAGGVEVGSGGERWRVKNGKWEVEREGRGQWEVGYHFCHRLRQSGSIQCTQVGGGGSKWPWNWKEILAHLWERNNGSLERHVRAQGKQHRLSAGSRQSLEDWSTECLFLPRGAVKEELI